MSGPTPIFHGLGTCRKHFQEMLTWNMGISCLRQALCRPTLAAGCGKLFTLDLQVSINMFSVDSTDGSSNRLKSMVPSSPVGGVVPVCATLALFLCKCCEKISVVFPRSSTSLYSPNVFSGSKCRINSTTIAMVSTRLPTHTRPAKKSCHGS